MDGLIRIAKAAKRLGLNRSTLTRQVKAGLIRSHNGLVRMSEVLEDRANNIDARVLEAASQGDPVQQNGDNATGVQQNPDATNSDDMVITPVVTPKDAADAITLIRRVLDEEGVKAGAVDLNAARTAEVILKSRERWLRIEVESRRLVDAATVENVVFSMARNERDSWMNWPSRVAATMAAELGVDQVTLTIVMENHIRQHLTELATPEDRRDDVKDKLGR